MAGCVHWTSYDPTGKENHPHHKEGTFTVHPKRLGFEQGDLIVKSRTCGDEKETVRFRWRGSGRGDIGACLEPEMVRRCRVAEDPECVTLWIVSRIWRRSELEGMRP
nr:hypothetical protein CFP56_16951 [Quercus suber]